MKYKISEKKIKSYIGEKEYNDLRCLKGKSILIRGEKRVVRDCKDKNFIKLGA